MVKTQANKKMLGDYIALDVSREARQLCNLTKDLKRALLEAECFCDIPHEVLQRYTGETISYLKKEIEQLDESINNAGECADSRKEVHEN